MTIDVSHITYSDALTYLEDYLSETPIFGVTDDDYYTIALNFNLEVAGLTEKDSVLLL